MKVALTGATGFIGSHVLTELQDHGHEVTGLVRDASQVDILAGRGATANVIDLYDRAAVAGVLGHSDAAIHTASPGDATSADMDAAVVDAAIEAFAGTGKPFLDISGSWVYGSNRSISEESPFARRRSWRGRSRSKAECSQRPTCAGSWSSPVPPTATAEEQSPERSSVHPATMPAI